MIQQICLIVEEYQMLENKSIFFVKSRRPLPVNTVLKTILHSYAVPLYISLFYRYSF